MTNKMKIAGYICYNAKQQYIQPTHFATKSSLYKWIDNKWVKIKGKGRRMRKKYQTIPEWARVEEPTFFSRRKLTKSSTNYKTAKIHTIKI